MAAVNAVRQQNTLNGSHWLAELLATQQPGLPSSGAHRLRMAACSLPGRRPQVSNWVAASAMAARVSLAPHRGTVAMALPVAGLSTCHGVGRVCGGEQQWGPLAGHAFRLQAAVAATEAAGAGQAAAVRTSSLPPSEASIHCPPT